MALTYKQVPWVSGTASVIAAFLSPWIVMVVLGALHDSYSKIPNLSYWVTFGILMLLRGVYQHMTYDYQKSTRATYKWEQNYGPHRW